MNKLVLIGNGFDLAHGLKTSYSDFILWYLNKNFQIMSRKADYDDGLMYITQNWPIQYTEFLSIEDFKERKKPNNNELRIKYKNPFISKIIENFINKRWVDIESEYYNSLLNIYRKLEINNNEKEKNNVFQELLSLNTCFELLKNQLSEYLESIEITESKKIHDIKLIIDNLINTVNENNKRANLESAEEGLCFLNFNYTNTLDLYIDNYIYKNISVNYIHGKLLDKKNPIIFGYGDEMDTYYEKIERLNENEFLKNIKSFSYFKTNNYNDFIRFIDSKQFEVYIMGHSCGLSDRIMLNYIFEHENCRKIKIYYYQKNENNTDNDFFEKTQEISRHFKAENKSKMRKRIIPFSKSQPLTKYKLL